MRRNRKRPKEALKKLPDAELALADDFLFDGAADEERESLKSEMRRTLGSRFGAD